jgi:hypothetical protein
VFNPDESPDQFQWENLWRFNPWSIARSSKEVNDVRYPTWPWENLQQARECVERYGLDLQYESKWRKEGWDQEVRRAIEVEY